MRLEGKVAPRQPGPLQASGRRVPRLRFASEGRVGFALRRPRSSRKAPAGAASAPWPRDVHRRSIDRGRAGGGDDRALWAASTCSTPTPASRGAGQVCMRRASPSWQRVPPDVNLTGVFLTARGGAGRDMLARKVPARSCCRASVGVAITGRARDRRLRPRSKGGVAALAPADGGGLLRARHPRQRHLPRRRS